VPRRVHLPVLDRRLLLRGAAAALLASLSGCRIVLDEPGDPNGTAPDAGLGDDGAPPVPGDGIERCGDELCLDLAHPANAPLRAIDGARLVIFEGMRMIVVRVGDAQIVALSAVCTHSGCTVHFSASRDDIECSCHGSTFALDGRVTRGPAERPLAGFVATLDAATNQVTIAL
jgi:cytochrome b6-f complex iron-sulfur subunit